MKKPINVPEEERARGALQMKMIVLVTIATLFITMAEYLVTWSLSCNNKYHLLENTYLSNIWPLNSSYVATLTAADFSERDICRLVTTMSCAFVTWALVSVVVVARIVLSKPLYSFSGAVAILGVCVVFTSYGLIIGIDRHYNLFGPSIHNSIGTIATKLLVFMFGWFEILFLFVIASYAKICLMVRQAKLRSGNHG